jgi:hypothetical protein
MNKSPMCFQRGGSLVAECSVPIRKARVRFPSAPYFFLLCDSTFFYFSVMELSNKHEPLLKLCTILQVNLFRQIVR